MLTICVDFDGVLHSYTTPWKGAHVIPDPPVPGAIAWLNDLLAAGFAVCIFSSRSSSVAGVQAMKEWLSMHGAKADKIAFPISKPPAHLTVDDRAFCFEGTFPSVDAIRAFKPWNKRTSPSPNPPASANLSRVI